MDIHTRSTGDVTIFELAGRFDNYSTPPLVQQLDTVTQVPPARVVINLSQVTFVDSTGLATLVQAMRHCRRNEGNLYLCEIPQSVQMIFELTRLDKAFSTFVDEEQAVQAFSS